MALIKCADCKKKISDRTSNCPHCGCPTSISISEDNTTNSISQFDEENSNKSKRYIFFIIGILIFLIISLSFIISYFYKSNKETQTDIGTDPISQKTISVGNNRMGRFNTDDWSDIVSISAAGNHTFGLKNDGTVLVAGSKDNDRFGESNVEGWTDIVAVSAEDFYTVGLKKDGTVVAVGGFAADNVNAANWTDIIAISTGSSHTVGLKNNGTVVVARENPYFETNVDDWKDIISISTGSVHTVGLKKDGTVVATGTSTNIRLTTQYGIIEDTVSQCDVDNWSDIIAISAGFMHTVGLKKDGTVVAVGWNAHGQCNVNDWTDIVAISAGDTHTVGLKKDGTVVAVGSSSHGQCNVNDWINISAIFAGNECTIGFKTN